MLGAEHDEVLGLADRGVVLAERGHRRGDLVEDQGRVAGGLGVVDVVRALAAVHGDRRRRVDAAAAGVGLPWRLVEVLGGAEGVLRRLPVGGGVAGPGSRAGHVQHRESHRPAHRGVGPVARAERADSRVETRGAGDLAVHEHHRRDRVGGGVHPAEVDLRPGQRAQGREHDGEHPRRAAGEHAVDRDHPPGDDAGPRLEGEQHLVGVAVAALQHPLHPLPRGREDGQPVTEAALVEQLEERLGGVGHLDEFGCVARRHPALPVECS